MKLRINGDISQYNGEITELRNKIKNAKSDEPIELEINSYGGDAFLGISIMNTLRAHGGEVTVNVTGIAASAASIIAMGADKVRIYNNAQLMIHNPWTFALGNAEELRKIAGDLDKIQESVVASYTHRLDLETAQDLLDGETYLTAKEALEYGLADEIIEAEAKAVESDLFAAKAKEFNAKTGAGSEEPKDEQVATLEVEIDTDAIAAAVIEAIKADRNAEEAAAAAASKQEKDAIAEQKAKATRKEETPEKKVLSIFK